MPTIYRARCGHCDQSPEINSAVTGWVTTDGQKGGKLLPDGYLAVKLDSGNYVTLPHPIERRVLQRQGFTWNQASQQSRLFRFTFKICVQCGTILEERQHQDIQTGCSVGLIGATMAVFPLKFWFKNGWIASLLMSYFVALGLFGLMALINWFRWRGRNHDLKLTACPKCGGRGFRRISQATGKSWPCPFCKTQNMKYTTAGIS